MEHHLTDSRAKVVITVDLLFDKVAEVSEKASFPTVIVASIFDFLLEKIPAAPVRPLLGKTVLNFMDAI